jgi:tRNA(fMet)-specific endonuclease VapC
MKYLLDTNIVVFWLKKRYGIGDKIAEAGEENCFVSEVTVAKLWFGVECTDAALIEQK